MVKMIGRIEVRVRELQQISTDEHRHMRCDGGQVPGSPIKASVGQLLRGILHQTGPDDVLRISASMTFLA
jgi:hypothetical protein